MLVYKWEYWNILPPGNILNCIKSVCITYMVSWFKYFDQKIQTIFIQKIFQYPQSKLCPKGQNMFPGGKMYQYPHIVYYSLAMANFTYFSMTTQKLEKSVILIPSIKFYKKPLLVLKPITNIQIIFIDVAVQIWDNFVSATSFVKDLVKSTACSHFLWQQFLLNQSITNQVVYVKFAWNFLWIGGHFGEKFQWITRLLSKVNNSSESLESCMSVFNEIWKKFHQKRYDLWHSNIWVLKCWMLNLVITTKSQDLFL